MHQTHIILTQSFVDESKLKHSLAKQFWEQGNQLSTLQSMLEMEIISEYSNWNMLRAMGGIIDSSYTDKKSFSKEISQFYRTYSSPSLLFLGSLSSYSIELQEGMLKLLEEPPHNLHIILFAHNKSEILPTIQSRARIYTLQREAVFGLLDKDLLTKVSKKLPPVSQSISMLLKGNQINFSNISKIEREEISFWCWQFLAYLEEYYKQNQSRRISYLIERILAAQSYNDGYVQKRFVLGYIGNS